MYEDTPQELVHDLFSAGDLRQSRARPAGDRHRGGDLERQPARARRLPPHHVHRPATSSSRRRGTSPTTSSSRCWSAASAGATWPDRDVRASAGRSATRPRRASASSARTPSSTTSASAPPASRAPTAAASRSSLLDSILGGSASSRLFQEIREKRGMAYSVYSFASQYTDTGMIGVYVGTREENLDACVEITVEQIGEIAAGSLRAGELERAKESLKGRITLSMESTSNRMSRLGKSLSRRHRAAHPRPDHRRDRRRRRATSSPIWRPSCSRPSGSPRPGVGPDEDRFRARDRQRTALAAGLRHEARAVRRRRARWDARSRRCSSRPATRCAASSSASRPRLPGSPPRSTSRRRMRRRRTCGPPSSRASRASSVRRAGIAEPLGHARRRAGPASVRRPELLDRRGADDALRARGGRVSAARRDRRAAQRGEARRAVRHGAARPPS